MKKMTRILAMILVMCMLLMTGCSQESPEDTTPQGEMEENVGNNTADSGTDDAEATSSNDPVPITDPSKEVNCTQENGHDGFDPRPRLVDTHLTHRVRGTSSVIK